MKNRRIVVVALVLAAVICVGVGYAAMQEQLTLTGKIQYDATFPIYWGTVTDTDGILEEVPSTSQTKTLTVSIDTTEWASVPMTKTFKAEVSNESRYEATATVSAVTLSDKLADYSVTALFENGTATADIGAGETAVVIISITMNSYPDASITEEDATFSFTVTADQVTGAGA